MPTPETVRVTIQHCIDGDTYSGGLGGLSVVMRLAGFDAPERSQPRGQWVIAEVKSLIIGLTFDCVIRGMDHYGRTIVQLFYTPGRDLAFELIRQGLGWADLAHAPNPGKYLAAQDKAQKHKDGIWQDPDPIPPSAWRAAHRGPWKIPNAALHKRHRGA